MIKDTPKQETVSDGIAKYLSDVGVRVMFGVISIHNMPILDAIARQNIIRFVPTRGEAGAINMADAYSRVSGNLGVCITSTGTAAGNAAGSQLEALTAESRLLHITTQIDTKFLDGNSSAIHSVPNQPDMLKSISKAYFFINSPKTAIETLSNAISSAISPPSGPVSLEIPIDIQLGQLERPVQSEMPKAKEIPISEGSVKELAELVKKSKRPMLWLGGGSCHAYSEANELVNRGFGVVTSTHGRATIDEGHKASLGAFNMTQAASNIYSKSDLMIVVGSKLRGNETLNYNMKLPPLVQIDANDFRGIRNYKLQKFIHGDSKKVLQKLLELLPKKLNTDKEFHSDIHQARLLSESQLLKTLGPYENIAKTLNDIVFSGSHPWVRDVTIANSTFGNRYVRIAKSSLGVHALGGGIGQGISMAIGAAIANKEAKTIALIGDGGAMLGISEMITAVSEKANLVFILMNDQAYGVIENIQDANYDGHRFYSKLDAPDFSLFCQSINLPHQVIRNVEKFRDALEKALDTDGPQMIEVDMCSIGGFQESFSGPPAGAVNTKEAS